MRKYGSKLAHWKGAPTKGHACGKGSKRRVCSLCQCFNCIDVKSGRGEEKRKAHKEITSQLNDI